eukprot:m.177581 g.177581  ORF g.177581 m.177581 type:complete len:546 (-) comp31900_c0_seq1:232-1869(-)
MAEPRRDRPGSTLSRAWTGSPFVIVGVLLSLGFFVIPATLLSGALVIPSIVDENTRTVTAPPQHVASARSPVDLNTVIDVIIIGAGPAGLAAAIYASRAMLTTVVFGSTAGGQLTNAMTLRNYPGWKPMQRGANHGSMILEDLRTQAEDMGATFIDSSVLVETLTLHTKPFVVDTVGMPAQTPSQLRAHTIIIATGALERHLDVVDSDELWGRHLHSCVTCDGSLYLDKAVLVVGGGDSAIDAAQYLCRFAAKVFLVHRRDEFRSARVAVIDDLRNNPIVDVLTSYVVESWTTIDSDEGQTLVGAKLKHIGTIHNKASFLDITVAGAFVLIGSSPNTKLVQHSSVKLTTDGYVVLDKRSQRSSVDGVFAAGHASDNVYRQAITAAAEGARAAMDAELYIRSLRLTKPNRQRHSSENNTSTLIIRTTIDTNDVIPTEIDCDLSTEACITKVVKATAVVVFSKTWCPYCKRALETLESYSIIGPLVIDLTGSNGRNIQNTLGKMTKRMTVPNIFIGGEPIGGADETIALHRKGKLLPLLQKANAIRP